MLWKLFNGAKGIVAAGQPESGLLVGTAPMVRGSGGLKAQSDDNKGLRQEVTFNPSPRDAPEGQVLYIPIGGSSRTLQAAYGLDA